MSLPTPVIIQGPAIVTFNGQSFYTKGGIKKTLKRDTFDVTTDAWGKVDERLTSQVTELSFTPAGNIGTTAQLTAHFPYAASAIGQSIFNPAGGADLPLVIQTLAGETITYPRAAITKLPTLNLKATDTLLGEITFTALTSSSTQLTATGALKTNSTTAFSDTTFDPSKIFTAAYQAAWGSTSPYNAMISTDGFEFSVDIGLKPVTVDVWGVVDMYLESIVATAKFAPANLTETQLDTLLNVQGTNAIVPGMSLAVAGTDLVISSAPLTVTLKNAGPKDADYIYTVGQHRFQGVQFISKRTFTTGAANPLWIFSVT